MRIHCPSRNDTAGLRRLWKQSFPDDDLFLDRFFSIAYSPSRCLCVSEGEQILAALYWFDASCCGKPLAYLYAVAGAEREFVDWCCRQPNFKAVLCGHFHEEKQWKLSDTVTEFAAGAVYKGSAYEIMFV